MVAPVEQTGWDSCENPRHLFQAVKVAVKTQFPDEYPSHFLLKCRRLHLAVERLWHAAGTGKVLGHKKYQQLVHQLAKVERHLDANGSLARPVLRGMYTWWSTPVNLQDKPVHDVQDAFHYHNHKDDYLLWCATVRCIFGTPFAKSGYTWVGNTLYPAEPVTGSTGIVLSPVPWLTPDVLRMAEAAWESTGFLGHLDPTTVAVLADALEEANCTGQVLAHLREPGHVKGCHILSLILRK